MDISKTTVLLQAPNYTLQEWRAFEVRTSAHAAEGTRTLHLMGWCHGNTRVCSSVTDVDTLLRSCLTRSSNVYQVLAPPASCLSGSLLDLWNTWKTKNHVSWEQDVTSELENEFRRAEDEWRIDASSAPTDFPTDYFLGTVPGAQPKVLAREIDGRYAVGPTREELLERYKLCLRLAAQYRRHASSLEKEANQAEGFIRDAFATWDLSAQERQWLMSKL